MLPAKAMSACTVPAGKPQPEPPVFHIRHAALVSCSYNILANSGNAAYNPYRCVFNVASQMAGDASPNGRIINWRKFEMHLQNLYDNPITTPKSVLLGEVDGG